ncbi:MAG: hypothetical protein IAG10_08605 [Planctomycetaceae bacterium]|nr:hypothetical protein [Planctomycetaceae bacterium]
MKSTIALVMLTLVVAVNVLAQEAATTPEDTTAKKIASPIRKLMDESLSWNELFVNDRSATPMTTKVVLRWTNNTRGSEDGMTVLYLADGRPEAVCCFYPWEKSFIHEFDSMSRGTLLAKRDGLVVWSPEKPGVQFQSIPEADAPAEMPVARLRQMKSLASQFSSTMLGWKADKSDREPLRQLPQPLYRYDSKRSDVLDGTVFAFVQGTDPESLLLIEAFKKGDGFEWQFAFVRRTSGELEGRHKDNIVWHADRFPTSNDPRSTHRSLGRPLDLSVLRDLPKKGE